MPLKTPKNNRAFLALACVLMWMASMLFPLSAVAYDFNNPYGRYDLSKPENTISPYTNRVCAIDVDMEKSQNMKEYGLTKRIVLCVKESIVSAVYNVLVPFSAYFSGLVSVMCALALIIFGIKISSGMRRGAKREAMLMGLKIGIVMMFSANFAAVYFDPDFNTPDSKGGLFGMMLDAMEDMLNIVAGYAINFSSIRCSAVEWDTVLSVWDAVDCTIETLVGGIFSPFTIIGGVVGFLVAALVSNVIGLFIGVVGFLLILMLLFAIARAVYVFITAYIAVAIMVLISPMFIPLILFTYTKAYFEKWLRLTLGFILQPIFVFAYLSMLIAAFDTIVYTGDRSLYRAIVGNYIDDPDFTTLGNHMHLIGGYWAAKQGEMAVQMNYKALPTTCPTDDTTCATRETVKPFKSGIFGTIGEEVITNTAQLQGDIYNALGGANIFKTSIPVTGVDWEWMAVMSKWTKTDMNAFLDALSAFNDYDMCYDNKDAPGCGGEQDPQDFLGKYYRPYLIGVLLSGIMALVTSYIFMLMLDVLPFIGSGISGESLSMPIFGSGNFGVPGSKMLDSVKKKIAGDKLSASPQ